MHIAVVLEVTVLHVIDELSENKVLRVLQDLVSVAGDRINTSLTNAIFFEKKGW